MTDEPVPVPAADVAAAAETLQQAVDAAHAVGQIKGVEPRPNEVVNLAVKGIVMITAMALLGAIGLLAQDKAPPDGIIAIASGGTGALATLLTVRGLGDGK